MHRQVGTARGKLTHEPVKKNKARVKTPEKIDKNKQVNFTILRHLFFCSALLQCNRL